MENDLSIIKQLCPKCGFELADYSGCVMYDGLRQWRTPCANKNCNYISVYRDSIKVELNNCLSKLECMDKIILLPISKDKILSEILSSIHELKKILKEILVI